MCVNSNNYVVLTDNINTFIGYDTIFGSKLTDNLDCSKLSGTLSMSRLGTDSITYDKFINYDPTWGFYINTKYHSRI